MHPHSNRRQFLQSVGAGSIALAGANMFDRRPFPAIDTASSQSPTLAMAVSGEFLRPEDEPFNVVGNGTWDDSVAFSNLLAYASEHGKTVYIKSGMHIRVRDQLFIYGYASIVGESRENSRIILEAYPGEPLPPHHWIHCGIADGSTLPRPWRGRIDNVQFLIKTPTHQAISFYAAENFAFTSCVIDQRPVGHQASNCLNSEFSSQCSPSYACMPKNGQITNNLLLASANGLPEGGGGGGINLIGVDSLLIASNHIEGFGDDAIAVISSQNCVIRDNWARGIRSRIGSFSGRQNSFYNNYLERQPGCDGVWQPSAMFYATFLQSPYAIPPTPENITFSGNLAVLPASAPDAGNTPADFMLIGGVHGCVVQGNMFINNSRQTVLPRLRLIPMGLDPNLPGDHVSRPRSVEISANIMGGSFPGTIEEQLGEGPNGPIIYGGNIASGFNIQHPNSVRIAALTINEPPAIVDSNRKV